MKSLSKSVLKKILTIRGDLSGAGKRIGIVVADFNEFLTHRLLESTVTTLVKTGVRPKDITVLHVPGAFEIPLGAQKLITRKKPHAVITLSVVVKGKTKHFNQVVRETACGVRELSARTGVPILLGMIPASNVRQAIERLGIKDSNKGRQWALSAVEMASACRRLASGKAK